MTTTDGPRIIRNTDPNGSQLADADLYPKASTHTWGAFAGLAIEFEGYNDAAVIDPNSGDRLYVPNLPEGLPAILRAIADATEATGFGQG